MNTSFSHKATPRFYYCVIISIFITLYHKMRIFSANKTVEWGKIFIPFREVFSICSRIIKFINAGKKGLKKVFSACPVLTCNYCEFFRRVI